MKNYKLQDFIKGDSEFFRILKSIPPIGENGPWIAGGSIWKSIEGQKLTCDIDIFFQSTKQCEEWYREILSIPYVNRIVSEIKSNKYNTSFKYLVNCGDKNKNFTIQLISFKFFKDICELIDGFDFTACQFGYDGTNLYTGDTSMEDVKNRDIIFRHISNYNATAHHLKKYTDIGFKVSEAQNKILTEYIIKDVKVKGADFTLSEIIQGLPPSERPTNPCGEVYIDDDAYPEPEMGSDGIDLSRITSSPTLSNQTTTHEAIYEPDRIGVIPSVYTRIEDMPSVEITPNTITNHPPPSNSLSSLWETPIIREETIFHPVYSLDVGGVMGENQSV